MLAAFTQYTDGTNNHLLLSFFEGVLTRITDWQEWILRLPSLFAAIAFSMAVIRLTRRFLTPGWQAAAVLVIMATPLFSDYLVQARGYALGIAFVTWVAAVMVDALTAERLSGKQAIVIGVLSALAIASVPSYVLDVGVLTGASWFRVGGGRQ